MSLFEFLMTLLTIVVGLGLSELLSGLARFLRRGRLRDFCYPHSVLVITLLLVWLQFVWESWALNSIPTWTFPAMLLMLAAPILLFLISHLLWPDNTDEHLDDYYYARAPTIYSLLVVTSMAAVLFRPLAFGMPLLVVDNLSNLPILVILAVLALSKNRPLHTVLTSVCLAAVVADILFLSFQIA